MTREEKNKLKEQEEIDKTKKYKKEKLIKNIFKIIFLLLLLIFSLFYYMRFYEVKKIKVKEIKIEDKKITKEFNGLKLIHISDIHYLMTTEYKDLNKIVNKINYINPDILVITGDLLDKSITYTNKDYNSLIKLLNKINVNISKYYIKGDQDYKFKEIEKIYNDSNFINLTNSQDNIYLSNNNYITIKGYGSSLKDDFKYKENSNNNYTISLIHEPDNADLIKDSNLILAGHSNNLQINIPIIKKIFIKDGCKKYYDNYYKVNNTKLYINSGIGTTNFKLRLFNPPTINFYRLVNK